MSLEDMIKHYFYVNGYNDENIKELLKIVSKIFNEYIIKRDEKEVVITYFSPFLKIPFMIETETHKFMIEVIKTISKDETK